MVVDHDREHVGRRTVGAEQDEIVELGIGDADLALDEVVDDGLAFLGRLDADDEGLALLLGAAFAGPPLAVDAEGAALGLGCLAARGELLLRQIAAIGRTARDQVVRDLGVALFKLRLEIGIAVAFNTEP
jgi:hypothetical protein